MKIVNTLLKICEPSTHVAQNLAEQLMQNLEKFRATRFKIVVNYVHVAQNF